MLNIPETVKALYKRDGVNKNFRAHFPNGELADITNENIVQESVKFSESVCSQDVFKFGLTEASVIEFETVGVANMYGMTIECFNEIDCSSLTAGEKADIAAGTWDGIWDAVNEVFAVPYGVFRVESCPRDHQAMAHRKVTAYTAEPQYFDSETFPFIPANLPWKMLQFNWYAMGYLITVKESQLTDDAASFSAQTVSKTFYNSGKDSISISVPLFSATSGYNQSDLSFCTIQSLTQYKTQYVSLAKEILDAINATGLDLTCDSDGNRIYESNELALKARLPFLLEPCVRYRVQWGASTVVQDLFTPCNLDGVTPIVSASGVYSAVHPRLGVPYTGRPSIFAMLGDGPFTISITTNSVTETVQVGNDLHLPPTSAKLLSRGLSGGLRSRCIRFNGEPSTIKIGSNTGVIDAKAYNYEGTFPVRDMLNAMFEITAQFYRPARSGGFEMKSISNSSPVAVLPGEYSQIWFDEYDVEPVGVVRYKFIDEAEEEQIIDFRIGGGSSVYDMTDNAIFNLLPSQTAIENFIVSSFAPNLAPINFVPIDLAAKGLPYIEAGDALAVTAQDGTVCNSYALRREMNGVQVLTDQIDSQSGLIIDSGEGS